MKMKHRHLFIIRILIATFLIITSFTSVVFSSRPTEELIKSFHKYSEKVEKNRKKAKPWKKALSKALNLKIDNDTLLNIFLITYKHYDGNVHKGKKLSNWANDIAGSWAELDLLCKKEGLDAYHLSSTIYRLTNSDFGPVSFSIGKGTDSVQTGADLMLWGKSLVSVGIRAKSAGLSPEEVWRKIIDSYQINSVEQIDRLDVNHIPPAPKW
ncbi:hypothetical protein ACFL5S_01235 [Fibrobacterota bacterium]